jgi:FMN phosphatase YigB (HAD superfamily)
MYVVTKGDFYGQSRKASFLPKVFDGLFVLPHKSKYTWNGVLETTQVDRFSTVVVGDSVKDDINPALECGLKAIKMTREYTEWVGDPKTDTLSPVPEIHSLLDLIPELQKMQA